MKFRSDINLLRALSIIFVTLFHFKIPYINNGFVGVDIFFVISGFLMTKIVFNYFYSKTTIPKLIGKFYLARFKRIVPPLLILCLSIFIYSYFNMIYLIYQRVVHEALYALEFFSNQHYYKSVGYFDTRVTQKWLLHTWSLSVEMQFYLFYPFILILSRAILGIKNVKWVVLILFILSLIVSIYYSKTNLNHAYYLLDTRAWELLAGAIVYLFPFKLQSKPLQYITVLLLIIFIFLPSLQSYWMGVVTLLPILLAMLFLYSQSDTSLSNNRILKLIGLWSYSIYLWHWVIVVFFSYYQIFDIFWYKALGTIISIALGSASYYFIERKINVKVIFVLWIITTLLFNYIYLSKVGNSFAYIDFGTKYNVSNISVNKLNPKSKFIFAGDSHTRALRGLINYLSKKYDVNTSVIYKHFGMYNDDVIKKVINIKNSNNKIIFLLRRWEEYNLTNDANKKRFDKKLSILSKNYKKVVILLQVPRQNDLSEVIYVNSFVNRKISYTKLYNSSVSLKKYKKEEGKINLVIESLAKKYQNVIVLDPTQYLCDLKRCPVGTATVSYYQDNHHLNNNGAMKLKKLFEPFFKKIDYIK